MTSSKDVQSYVLLAANNSLLKAVSLNIRELAGFNSWGGVSLCTCARHTLIFCKRWCIYYKLT